MERNANCWNITDSSIGLVKIIDTRDLRSTVFLLYFNSPEIKLTFRLTVHIIVCAVLEIDHTYRAYWPLGHLPHAPSWTSQAKKNCTNYFSSSKESRLHLFDLTHVTAQPHNMVSYNKLFYEERRSLYEGSMKKTWLIQTSPVNPTFSSFLFIIWRTMQCTCAYTELHLWRS